MRVGCLLVAVRACMSAAGGVSVVVDVSVCSTWAVAWAKGVAGCACKGRHGQCRS